MPDPAITAEDRELFSDLEEICHMDDGMSDYEALPIIARHRSEREKRLVEALRFYADESNHDGLGASPVERDSGKRARHALKEYDQ